MKKIIALTGVLVAFLGWFVVIPRCNTVPYSKDVSQCASMKSGFEVVNRWPAGPDGCYEQDEPTWYRPWKKRFR